MANYTLNYTGEQINALLDAIAAISTLPTEAGNYVLTVTSSEGTVTYTWTNTSSES